MARKRNRPGPSFKAKVALSAVKEIKTVRRKNVIRQFYNHFLASRSRFLGEWGRLKTYQKRAD